MSLTDRVVLAVAVGVLAASLLWLLGGEEPPSDSVAPGTGETTSRGDGRSDPSPGIPRGDRVARARELRRLARRRLAEPGVELENTFRAVERLEEARALLDPVRREEIELSTAVEADLQRARRELDGLVREVKRRYVVAEGRRDRDGMRAALDDLRRIVPDPTHPDHRWARERTARVVRE